jgi:hypothetical protein
MVSDAHPTWLAKVFFLASSPSGGFRELKNRHFATRVDVMHNRIIPTADRL